MKYCKKCERNIDTAETNCPDCGTVLKEVNEDFSGLISFLLMTLSVIIAPIGLLTGFLIMMSEKTAVKRFGRNMVFVSIAQIVFIIALFSLLLLVAVNSPEYQDLLQQYSR